MSNNFGYMRISTKEERGLQKFSRQERKLESWKKQHEAQFVLVGKDDASGKNFEREDWKRIESLVQPGDCIVFPDLSRFTRGDAEVGYEKYMELFNTGIRLEFIDNPTLNTEYIEELLKISAQENILTRVMVESVVKILIIAELNKCEQERLTTVQRIKDGIAASDKKSGRKPGQLDKMTPELEQDIKLFLADRNIKQKSLMDKHSISRNTLKKYVDRYQKEEDRKSSAGPREVL